MNQCPRTLRTLLEGTIDYAGLFPPAGLPMGAVAEHYASYRTGPAAWLLGRCVIPAQRLEEFRSAIRSSGVDRSGVAWSVSALTGSDPGADARRIREIVNHDSPGTGTAMSITAIETRADSPRDVGPLLKLLPAGLPVFVEIPLEADPGPFLAAIAAAGAAAKVRTGGTTREAFPTSGALARFILSTIAAGVPFKCTAGLHHPIRGVYRLTYEPKSPAGTMFGFLNLLLGAAFTFGGLPRSMLNALLGEEDASAFRFTDREVRWNGHTVTDGDLQLFRQRFGVSFGSCSFSEPLEELHALGFL